MKKKNQRFERFAILPIEEASITLTPFSGIKIKPELRYQQIFSTPYCEKCGKEVSVVAVERDRKGLFKPWKYNFYSQDNILFEAHHKIPRSLGGRDILDNLQTLCQSCHKEIHGGK